MIAALSALMAVPPGVLAQTPPPPPGYELVQPSVTPALAFFAGSPIRIAFSVEAAAPLDLRVDVVRHATGRVVRRLPLAAAPPAQPLSVQWDGLTAAGEVAPDGRYDVRVGAAAGGGAPAGTFELHSHAYPIRGRHEDRGPIGAFGVGRSGGRTHEGFDVDAACGTPVVAARGGRVVRNAYDPVLYGNHVIIRGRRTQRDYSYSHLRTRSRVRVGEQVRTAERIGSIGATGNARTIGCHLHFEIRRRGLPIDPRPELHAWDGWS